MRRPAVKHPIGALNFLNEGFSAFSSGATAGRVSGCALPRRMRIRGKIARTTDAAFEKPSVFDTPTRGVPSGPVGARSALVALKSRKSNRPLTP